jgi:hypothetical protein
MILGFNTLGFNYQSIENWVGPRAGMDTVEKKQASFPCRQSNLVLQLVT